MIISNAIPKAGGHFLYHYLAACGLVQEPGELYADIHYKQGAVERRPVGQTDKGLWLKDELRTPSAILTDRNPERVVNAHVHDEVRVCSMTHKMVFLYRHPRNILTSAARFSAVDFKWLPSTEEPPKDKVLKLMRHMVGPTVARCETYKGWLTTAHTIVSFEQVVDPSTGVAAFVAEKLGLEPQNPTVVAGDNTPWLTSKYRGTWSGQLSRWEEYWDDTLEDLWKKHGGPAIEETYGY